MDNKKIIKILLALILLLLLGYVFYSVFISEKSPQTLTSENVEDENDDLTPEEVLEKLGGEETLEGDIQMDIISPEGDTFQQGQARLWRAQLSNFQSDASFRVRCHWKFYINENNEYVLYKNMEKSSLVSKENPNVCGFTSTFIDRVGTLRASLDAEISNSSNEVLAEYTAEREYVVK